MSGVKSCVGAAEISLADRHIGPDVIWRARGYHPAVNQHGKVIREPEHRVHVMLNQHNGLLALELTEKRDHAGGFVRPHPGYRLIEQEHARGGCQRHGDLELPVLAMAEISAQDIGPALEPDAGERSARRAAQFGLVARRPPEAERVARMGLD